MCICSCFFNFLENLKNQQNKHNFYIVNKAMSNVLTVVSYNIWFDTTLELERMVSLVEMFNQHKPDVICLQEVKPDIYELFINLLTDYRYHFPKKINKAYGCVTFSKYPISRCLDYDYENSIMGRSLIITLIDYPLHHTTSNGVSVETFNIVIANSHFESVFKRTIINEAKVKQYELARDILEKLYNIYHNVIFCSDTNVMPHEENEFNKQFQENGWIDSWVVRGSQLNQYTYDTEYNIHLNLKLLKFKQQP